MTNVPRRLTTTIVIVGLIAVSLIALLRHWGTSRVSEANTDVPARQIASGKRLPLIIKVRQEPVELEPVLGLGDAVTEGQLLKALCASAPQWHPPTVPSLIHELKLWGREANFTKAMVGQERTGTIMTETLLSDKLCRERTTPNGASFLLDSPFGIHVVQSGSWDAKGNRAEGHYGQLLMVLGEAGVPLHTPVTTVSGRTGTVADVLQDAIMRFMWTRELEFIGEALALWLPPETTWTNQFGDRYSFDELVQHLIAIPRGQGACGGSHVASSTAAILRVDDQYRLLSPSVRKQALVWFADLSELLERTQRPEGGWDRTWPGTKTKEAMYHHPVLDRITVIGHHLEWIAIVPESVRPSKKTVARAVAALAESFDALPAMEHRSFKSILPCSHAANALCRLQGKEPYATWKEYWDSGRLVRTSRGLGLRRPNPMTESVSETPLFDGK